MATSRQNDGGDEFSLRCGERSQPGMSPSRKWRQAILTWVRLPGPTEAQGNPSAPCANLLVKPETADIACASSEWLQDFFWAGIYDSLTIPPSLKFQPPLL